MDGMDEEIVEPYPGRPASVWWLRLGLRGRKPGFLTPERMKAVTRGVDEALGEPDTVQEDALSRFSRLGDRSARVGRAGEAWMPRFDGDMPRLTPREEELLASGRSNSLIAPWTDPKPPNRRPRPTPWRWRLLAFVYLLDELALLVAAPVDTDPYLVSRRVHRRVARHWVAAARRSCDAEWKRLTAGGTGALWQQQPVEFPLRISPDRVGQVLTYLHQLPVWRGLGWHPQQWWWSSYREYVAADPMQRECVPRVFPLRADPRRPWLNHGVLFTDEELTEAWRRKCFGRARRLIEYERERLEELAYEPDTPARRDRAQRIRRKIERLQRQTEQTWRDGDGQAWRELWEPEQQDPPDDEGAERDEAGPSSGGARGGWFADANDGGESRGDERKATRVGGRSSAGVANGRPGRGEVRGEVRGRVRGQFRGQFRGWGTAVLGPDDPFDPLIWEPRG